MTFYVVNEDCRQSSFGSSESHKIPSHNTYATYIYNRNVMSIQSRLTCKFLGGAPGENFVDLLKGGDGGPIPFGPFIATTKV